MVFSIIREIWIFNKIQENGYLNHDVTWCPAAKDRLESAGHLLYVKSFILQHNTEGFSLYLCKSDKKPHVWKENILVDKKVKGRQIL